MAANVRSRAFALSAFVLCASIVAQRASAQSQANKDVSGTTWDCRVDLGKLGANGGLVRSHDEDHVLITFNPGGASVSAKLLSGWPEPPTDDGEDDWAFGEWEQQGATVRSVSNGTITSFHDHPWQDGDAEKMIELKISGEQMRGQLFSHAKTNPAILQCQLQYPRSDASLRAIKSSSQTVPGSPVVDVRVSSAYTRILTSEEMATLRDSLHWEPELVPLPRGGTAVSYLVDNEDRKLGSIRVQWTRTVVPKDTSTQPGAPAVGSFMLQMENGTSCGFLGQAQLEDSKGEVIVSSVDLDSWVGLGQPGSGQTIRVEGDANLPSPNPKILLRPLAVNSALSACVTPRNP